MLAMTYRNQANQNGQAPMNMRGQADMQSGGMRDAYNAYSTYNGAGGNRVQERPESRYEYDMQSRQRDSRGREHYDNGRYAPMKNAYAGMDGAEGGRMGGERMNTIGFFSPNEVGQEYRSNVEYNHGDEINPRQGGKHERGYGSGGGKPFDKETAKEWVQAIKKSMGQDWTIWTPEETKKFMDQARAECDPHEFWAVMNALHSDYFETAKKYGVERPDFFADLAKAWLEDKDAVKDKAAAYYEYVVDHRM